ncbi:hypothetical protein CYMTET_52362, partial [Cymbomonas tetramitiformis]
EIAEARPELLAAAIKHLPASKPRHITGLGMPEEVLQCVGRGVDIFDSVYPYTVTINGPCVSGSNACSSREASQHLRGRCCTHALPHWMEAMADQVVCAEVFLSSFKRRRRRSRAVAWRTGAGARAWLNLRSIAYKSPPFHCPVHYGISGSVGVPSVAAQVGSALHAQCSMRFEDQTLANSSSWKDSGPILANCECLACQRHTRSYLHHILNCHEMLADVLLDIHNTHHYLKFFRGANDHLPPQVPKADDVKKLSDCSRSQKRAQRVYAAVLHSADWLWLGGHVGASRLPWLFLVAFNNIEPAFLRAIPCCPASELSSVHDDFAGYRTYSPNHCPDETALDAEGPGQHVLIGVATARPMSD